MLEGIVADVLVRILGSYVDGLNKESIRVGVWRGALELTHLRLRPDALAVLFETLGLDLPVTVTAGYIGLLRLEVPWKTLRSAPVRIFMHDVTVVASPVTDGDQTALELRERRLKAAKLATDEAVRDAKFSVRSADSSDPSAAVDDAAFSANDAPPTSSRVARWGWRFTSRVVTKIVDNIQIDVENVVIQYEDASSVRDRPYTATLAMDSLRASSTNHLWKPVFIEDSSSPIVHKVLYMRGLVLNWEPGNSSNDLKSWILDPNSTRTRGQWAGFVRECSRQAIEPMDGELRIALTKSPALASALAGRDEKLKALKHLPRVQMDLHFPDVKIVLDDFQYHTLLSTIMYLSDIDRKVRPKTATGRWFWALDRLLPRFKQRREAALRFNAEGMRKHRETRDAYVAARNVVVAARRNGLAEPAAEAAIVEKFETELPFQDILLFRDLADRKLNNKAPSTNAAAASSSKFWSLFTRATREDAATPVSITNENPDDTAAQRTGSQEDVSALIPDISSGPQQRITIDLSSNSASSALPEPNKLVPELHSGQALGKSSTNSESSNEDEVVPNFRMGFLLGRGAIELKEGGYPDPPISVSSLEFRELRLGFETRPGSGLLLEALLGTFEVLDTRKGMKVMYPRVPWAGEKMKEHGQDSWSGEFNIQNMDTSTLIADLAEEWAGRQESVDGNDLQSSSNMPSPVESSIQSAHLHSYPHDICNAICEIRGEYGIETTSTPPRRPKFPRSNAYSRAANPSSSSDSLSGLSTTGLPNIILQGKDELDVLEQTPLQYIAALRLNQEEAPEGEWATGATRTAMDLAIGGMEVLVDGPKGAFISSVTFWHPREKMPSIMQFLTRAAAPRLAALRMDIQKAILDRSVPMRMDLLIRGPRFVIPGSADSNISLVLDLGTFAMETSTGPEESIPLESYESPGQVGPVSRQPDPMSVRYTDYKMACSDLGMFVVSDTGKENAERVIRPFSVHLLLQVLHNSAFVEAITQEFGRVKIPKVRLQGQLPSLHTYVSHNAFRQLLGIAKSWGDRSKRSFATSGIEPNQVRNSAHVSADIEEVRKLRDSPIEHQNSEQHHVSPLVAFDMKLEFEDLQLELRDSSGRRVVTLSSTGTLVKYKKAAECVDFEYKVRTFTVIDGSRGATAPFRRLAYAGTDALYSSNMHLMEDDQADPLLSEDSRAFISLSYHGDVLRHEQSLAVRILSLNIVCVRETYFALADFFYLTGNRDVTTPSPLGNNTKGAVTIEESAETHGEETSTKPDGGVEGEYSDPFVALGTTTSGAARALRERAGRGMELSKQAIANRGRLSVESDLDGLNITLVTAEGAIACFDVSACSTRLTQFSDGSIEASGELGGFGIRDLTSAYDVYAETIRYSRRPHDIGNAKGSNADGWSLKVPKPGNGNAQLDAHLRNLRIVYLQRFTVILKKYFDVLRESLRPVLEMKGGIAEVFEGEQDEDLSAISNGDSRIRVNVVTESIDIIMPRHSQSPYEALRFVVPWSSITNENIAAPGYQIGFQIRAEGVDAYVLYHPPAEGEGRALTVGGCEPIFREIAPDVPVKDLTPFAHNLCIIGKIDTWRRRRVPQVILNAEGIPVLKDGEEEREYDPAKWLPTIRVRISAPHGITARLCEAEYSILYFTFTENIIERPDIEFTDIVRGLKTPILPARKPVQPIMFSSNRMPPNYQILFEVPKIDSIIMSGGDATDEASKLIRSELTDLIGSFEYGVDYRMTIEVNANMHSLEDIRPGVPTNGTRLIMPIRQDLQPPTPYGEGPSSKSPDMKSEDSRSVSLTWDRPFGFRANVMVVVSDLRIIVVPELFRDLGLLTAPGFPFLKSSAPPPLLRFNGRLLILTISRPEIWLMANQYPGDGRSLVIRGDVIAKVQWAAVTGRNVVEMAANGLRVNLSTVGPFSNGAIAPSASPRFSKQTSSAGPLRTDTETPMLYPCDVSMKFEGRGYDPPKNPGDEPIKAPGSSLSLSAESILIRIDVNDAPLILAVGSRLVRLKQSVVSRRPIQPGRFEQWIDKGEEGDARLAVHFALPHCRLIFTDETAGRYIPIMEARVRNAVVRSNVPWLTNALFEFAIDLFNEEKGWWEPGVEAFPFELAASKGRSGSQAIHVRVERNIDINVTPSTVSGAARVSKALKSAIEDLKDRLKREDLSDTEDGTHDRIRSQSIALGAMMNPIAPRPSVAAFCVRNETGRSVMMWLPYDSTRRSLSGNGGEIEIDTPTEELLWSAISASVGLSTDPNRNRHLAMRCVISLSGYEPVTLSTADTGTRLVKFSPDRTEISHDDSGLRGQPTALTLVWSVTMRNGVPCGCIRSVLRLVNQTKTVLEVSIGGTRNDDNLSDDMNQTRTPDLIDNTQGIVKAGDSWSIPVHSVHRSVRIRPAIFHAPDLELPSSNSKQVKSRGRVFYSYKWSDPFSKIEALVEMGRDLHEKTKRAEGRRQSTDYNSPASPILICRASGTAQPFCFSILPVIDSGVVDNIPQGYASSHGWVELHICTPLVLENLLPRPVFFRLAQPSRLSVTGHDQVVAEGLIEPLREAHVHTAGADFSNVSLAMGMDNSPQIESAIIQPTRKKLPPKSCGDFYAGLTKLKDIPLGVGRYTPMKLNLDHDQALTTRYVRTFSTYWIRNRSDVDLFFRDSENNRDSSKNHGPKAYLRGRPPGTEADRFICFSGGWLSFQRADITEDIWTNVSTEVCEIDKPILLGLEGLSLLLEVRPAKGRFKRTFVATIRNAVWLENRTPYAIEWCQSAALNSRNIALSAKVHSVPPGKLASLHWDFGSQKKAICLRRASDSSSGEWIWSRPVKVEGVEGEFAAKMYRPKRHEQYIARAVISRLGNGVSAVIIHKEDRSTPPYRIINECSHRSIAFRQHAVKEIRPWLVRPGKSTRYSWDDPQAPVKRRSLIVEVIEKAPLAADNLNSKSTPALNRLPKAESICSDLAEVAGHGASGSRKEKETRYPKFELNIDRISEDVPFDHSKRFNPPLVVSVHVDGPTKVVTFSDGNEFDSKAGHHENSVERVQNGSESRVVSLDTPTSNLDVELFVNGLGISFVESTPAELAYLSVTGIHFRLDRFDGQQLIICEVQDVQLDNQLVQCTWPVVLWSPPPSNNNTNNRRTDGASSSADNRRQNPKPFFQFTVDGPFPSMKQGIISFRGIFVALQQLQLAADEDFVLRVWLFVVSLIDAAGGTNREKEEALDGKDALQFGLPLVGSSGVPTKALDTSKSNDGLGSALLNRLYVENVELCPLKLSISFTSSRTSKAAENVGGFRSLIRTLVAVLGNVENAEFRFNALQLEHVFDTTAHFRSLIGEFYVSQGSNQKMTLLTSNSLIGNPSALFDSIAIGTRDFFVEPANAKGSADFIASIGRGSSSLLTNTVGGIVGSLGGIPRAMAQGLETAVGDRDYLAERDSIRGGRARIVASPAQGLFTGALSFGHGIASGAAGLIRDPIQGATEDGPSGFIRGLGKGFIGGVLKPLTGALDLIAEPAAGFRSMMVSERNRDLAEPARPPRAFWGTNADQMTSYNLRSALGQAILEVVNRSESDHILEQLHSWTHLVPVHSSATDEDVIAFLWALMRRSTRSSHFQAKYLLDAQGNPQRAEKMRAGLITNKRLIITSLDGHVLWEYPLIDVVDTQVSLEAKDYLMIGVRPIGHDGVTVVAPNWKKIHCGSMTSRDEMNLSLRKAIQDLKTIQETTRLQGGVVGNAGRKVMRAKELVEKHTRDESVEMVDMSTNVEAEAANGYMMEMKSLHQDASVDGRRGIFTNMKLPGRGIDDGENTESNIMENDLSQELAKAMKLRPRHVSGAVRSVRVFVVNLTEERLSLLDCSLDSGAWCQEPAEYTEPKCILIFEADGTRNRVTDVSGYVEMKIGKENRNVLAIRFFNPLLASNAYAMQVPAGFTATRVGGEKGDHVTTVVTLKEAKDQMAGAVEVANTKRSMKISAEPLLFGRSKVSAFPASMTVVPPHAPKAAQPDPDDPELIGKLSSLGFSSSEAHAALRENGGDVSKAYAALVGTDEGRKQL